MPIPATEAVIITLEGSATEARFWRRGANLGGVSHLCRDISTLIHDSPGFPRVEFQDSGCVNGKSTGEERKDRKGKETYRRIVLNTLLTFKSITFANASSGCVSNPSPHVAPAFANKIST